MCKVLEDMRKEAADRAVWDEKVDTVFRLLELNLSHEQIAQGTGLAVEQVKEIAGQRSA
ncbi:MAG: hypothetical protein IKH57_09745 [Clostridia bacterium]|nr:hypothetical protein [Clostridia bacterium]